MSKAGLQKVTNGHGGKSVLFATGFKANKIRSGYLDLGRVLDDENAFMLRDEIGECVEQRRFFPLFFLN